MLSGAGWALAAAAVLAGVTGTWSPCGLSTIESLRRGGVHRGGVRVALASSLAFGAGAVAGGATTFTSLSLLGSLVAGRGAAASVLATTIAAAACALELRGARIVPQIRRQVPEPWRRRLPIGVAAAAYGVMLGLGFTTFVMTFAVWALAAIGFTLGSISLGLVIGAGFGLGRAVPVLVLTPLADRELGRRAIDGMLQRPVVLRSLRLADGAALAACAAALSGPALAAPAQVSSTVPPGFAGDVDPSADGTTLAYERLGVGGFIVTGTNYRQLPGDDPALGEGLVAWRDGDQLTVADQGTLTPRLTVTAVGADELAVSASWLVYRVPPSAAAPLYEIYAVSLAAPGAPRLVAAAHAPGQLGRPTLDGDAVLFSVSGRVSRILSVNLATGAHLVVRRANDVQLLTPSAAAGQLLYVRVDDCRQTLELGDLAGVSDRALASAPTEVPRDGGYGPGAIRVGRTPHHCTGPLAGRYTETVNYWTAALSSGTAYLSVLRTRGEQSEASIERLPAAGSGFGPGSRR